MLTYVCLLSLFSLCFCVVPDPFDSSNDKNSDEDESFYDIVYDSQINCPTYIEGMAVSDHVFVGAAINTKLMSTTADCLIECYKDSACKSVNVIPNRRRNAAVSKISNEKNDENSTKNEKEDAYICELNDFEQSDSPYLMISLDGATYFDAIKCASKENRVTETPASTTNNNFKAEVSNSPALSDKEIKRNRLIQLGNAFKNLRQEPNID